MSERMSLPGIKVHGPNPRARQGRRAPRLLALLLVLACQGLRSEEAAPGAPVAELTTLFPLTPFETKAVSGAAFKLAFRWQAVPTDQNYNFFVHILDDDGAPVMQLGAAPPVPTSQWSGEVRHDYEVRLPQGFAPGKYKIIAGLYLPAPPWGLQPLKMGEGVVRYPHPNQASFHEYFTVGALEVADAEPAASEPAAAPLAAPPPPPKASGPKLDLGGYKVTFAEDFDGPLDVSAWGPGTRWIAHTPYNGDFGEARFANPGPAGPFRVKDGQLTIEARNDGSGRKSGLLCSVDPQGNGFAQQYGYFELRARFPSGAGTWPVFRLLGVPRLKGQLLNDLEIGVAERLGARPDVLRTAVQTWGGDAGYAEEVGAFTVAGMGEAFHDYGALVTEKDTIFYCDGVELRRVPTPAAAKAPLYLILALAMDGTGSDPVPNPALMVVDHVKVYAKI